jgi:hypothetical protein
MSFEQLMGWLKYRYELCGIYFLFCVIYYYWHNAFAHTIHADVAMLVNFTTNYDSSVHRFIMSSPPFAINRPTCLTVVFASLSYFGVRLACINKNVTYADRLLYRSSLQLGYKQSRLQLDIAQINSVYDLCSVVFESQTTQIGVLAVINDVQLLPSKCHSDRGKNKALYFIGFLTLL